MLISSFDKSVILVLIDFGGGLVYICRESITKTNTYHPVNWIYSNQYLWKWHKNGMYHFTKNVRKQNGYWNLLLLACGETYITENIKGEWQIYASIK